VGQFEFFGLSEIKNESKPQANRYHRSIRQSADLFSDARQVQNTNVITQRDAVQEWTTPQFWD